jgi:hypothetical protein
VNIYKDVLPSGVQLERGFLNFLLSSVQTLVVSSIATKERSHLVFFVRVTNNKYVTSANFYENIIPCEKSEGKLKKSKISVYVTFEVLTAASMK